VNTSIVSIALIVPFLLISNFQMADSTLWDLLIEVNLEQNSIYQGEVPIVFGYVFDHAGKPVSDVDIKIRLGEDSIDIKSDVTGTFVVEFPNFAGIPGYHIVDVFATSGEKIGIKSTNFQVKGDIVVSSYTEKILSTTEAVKYLHASIEDFDNDPLGLTLFNYYQDLQTKFLEEQAIQDEIDKQQKLIEEQRNFSLELTQQIIEETNPGAGTYSGWKYDIFVSNLDLSVKEIILNQLEYTKTVFRQAQKAMDDVSANGGTWNEAMQAYYEEASISRELMNSFATIKEIENVTDSGNYTNTEVQYESEVFLNSTVNQSNEDNSNFILNVNGTNIDVGKTGTVIYLNINGTIVELIINGTQIEQLTNSSQN